MRCDPVPSQILSGLAGPFIREAGKVADNLFTSDEERLAHQEKIREIEAEANQAIITATAEYDREITTRHSNDMNSDSWLSKNLRPGLLVVAFVVVSLSSFLDGNITIAGQLLTIKESYVALWESVLQAGIFFYFGSRGIEKVALTRRK